MTTPLRDYMEKHNGLCPWSWTKINMAKCPFQSNKMIERGYGKEFKTDLVRGMEFLEAGIAIHELIESWQLYNLGLGDAELEEPGIILSTKDIPVSEWLPLIKEYEKAQQFFNYLPDGEPGFSGGEVVGVEEIAQARHDGTSIDWVGNDPHKPYAGGYLKGTLDLLQKEGKHLLVTDYKRQWNVLSRSDVNSNMQMLLYSLLALYKYPDAETVGVRMYFTRFSYTQEIVRESSEVLKVRPVFDQIIAGLTHNLKKHWDDPIPTPGEQCGICRYLHSCPISENVELVPRIRSIEEAKKIASELALRKTRVKRSTDRLKDWTAENGPITTEDGQMQYGYVSSASESWEVVDIDALMRVMLQEQINIKDILAPDTRKTNTFIKGIRKKNPELFNKLVGTCVRRKTSTSFRERKAKK